MNQVNRAFDELIKLAGKELKLDAESAGRVCTWLIGETREFHAYHGMYPTGRKCEDVIDNVFDLIRKSCISVSYQTLYDHYLSALETYITICKN